VDNLNKKGLNKGTRYCFCSENESISHLFFECVVAKVIWSHVSKFLGFEIEGVITLYVASKWLHKDKFYSVNTMPVVVLRSIWLVRSNFVFHKHVWVDVRCTWRMILRVSTEWEIICKESKTVEMQKWLCVFGDAGPGAAENRKRLKLSKGITPAGLMGAAMLVDG
jgi:hypothetical protein